jgi:hypothetical protein
MSSMRKRSYSTGDLIDAFPGEVQYKPNIKFVIITPKQPLEKSKLMRVFLLGSESGVTGIQFDHSIYDSEAKAQEVAAKTQGWILAIDSNLAFPGYQEQFDKCFKARDDRSGQAMVLDFLNEIIRAPVILAAGQPNTRAQIGFSALEQLAVFVSERERGAVGLSELKAEQLSEEADKYIREIAPAVSSPSGSPVSGGSAVSSPSGSPASAASPSQSESPE